ncbi:NAD(P)-dependent alcohol dehydrogenase [Conexibacter sp. S30A1]|uniref:NAD(P)-dependent alcohol dehydrogenase n=1 Tax=Conexibacter sp. S30A1 TaxID=2937800 RepID=UPI00200C2797|nr:NAD(P)-dependent alcohol dehydrogenase [Conexibacter sp. S30A1]
MSPSHADTAAIARKQAITAYARAMTSATASFETIEIERRELGPHDVLIEIAYVGICHTDVHHARAEFGHTHYPIVPGHEIAGTISAIGSDVAKFTVGDAAGIGCLVDSCRECKECKAGQESYCRTGKVLTYNGIGRDGGVTLGGYSERIVVDERFAVLIPSAMPLHQTAPLMCAGITMYQPLRHWGAASGKRVGIIGFGGLGHIGVQIAHALGAHVTVINKTEEQADDARRMGAADFRITSDARTYSELAGSLDLIVSTVPASYDMNAHLNLLDQDGVFVNLGVPEKPLSIEPYSLLTHRRSLAGSMSGGMPETQEMVDFCAEHHIGAEVEIIEAGYIDQAFDRLVASDVRYRFVIDASTFASD